MSLEYPDTKFRSIRFWGGPADGRIAKRFHVSGYAMELDATTEHPAGPNSAAAPKVLYRLFDLRSAVLDQGASITTIGHLPEVEVRGMMVRMSYDHIHAVGAEKARASVVNDFEHRATETVDGQLLPYLFMFKDIRMSMLVYEKLLLVPVPVTGRSRTAPGPALTGSWIGSTTRWTPDTPRCSNRPSRHTSFTRVKSARQTNNPRRPPCPISPPESPRPRT